MTKTQLPPLAQYMDLRNYTPQYGDYLIWSKWFSVWHGFVVNFDKFDTISVVFAGLPILLVTMDESEQQRETRKLSLGKIKNAVKGKFTVLRHDTSKNAVVWFV